MSQRVQCQGREWACWTHQMLRNLRSAAGLVASARDADVSDLTEKEHAEVDEILSQIIGDAIRIRSRLNK